MEYTNHHVAIEFHIKNDRYENKNILIECSLFINLFRYKSGTKLMKIRIVKPYVGHEIPSNIPDKILYKKCFLFKLEETYLNILLS